MEPNGLLMAALIIGLLVLALGIDQATEDMVQDSTVDRGSDRKARRSGRGADQDRPKSGTMTE